MPAPSIAISAEISGSVVAHGASDDLSAALLKHAGFQQIQDWHGRRHRLASTTPADESRAIATYAAQMLRAARYEVRLDPTLDASTEISPTNPLGPYKTGSEILRLTDQVWAAPDGQSLARPVEHLIHPQHGGLERVREALEAVSARLEELDDESFELRDRFETAAEFLTAAQAELTDAATVVRNIAPPPASQRAALAVSPSAADACVTPSPSATTAQSQAPFPTAHTPSPRGR
ncbi:hypothetical protein G3I42_30540 [Streptomyces sp. SID11385]|nr:hypothetical protein [Streptomyces sp. SID11385]NEA43529.1 hypothetical protein [Streptomyces sp. SID11385]